MACDEVLSFFLKHIHCCHFFVVNSKISHACSDQANCIVMFDLVTDDNVMDDEHDSLPMPTLTLRTVCDVKAGDEMTWSRLLMDNFFSIVS